MILPRPISLQQATFLWNMKNRGYMGKSGQYILESEYILTPEGAPVGTCSPIPDFEMVGKVETTK